MEMVSLNYTYRPETAWLEIGKNLGPWYPSIGYIAQVPKLLQTVRRLIWHVVSRLTSDVHVLRRDCMGYNMGMIEEDRMVINRLYKSVFAFISVIKMLQRRDSDMALVPD